MIWFYVCRTWSWINHNLSKEMKEISLVFLLFVIFFILSFVDVCVRILSSTHYKCIYTSNSTHVYLPWDLVGYFFFVHLWLFKYWETANTHKNEFYAHQIKHNNNKWRMIQNIIYVWIKMNVCTTTLCMCSIWLCRREKKASSHKQYTHRLTNRLKCKTSHFNI